MMKARDYQLKAVEAVRAARAASCVVSPTGSGKTFVMVLSLMDNVPQIVFTHRRVLIEQLATVLRANGINFGIRAAGYAPNPEAKIQIALYQSENIRVFKSKQWDIHPGAKRVHIDECHAIKGPVARGIIRAYEARGAVVIGYTATPQGTDGLFPNLINLTTVRALMDQKILVEPRIFTPLGPDLERLSKIKKGANGEYSPSALGKFWSPEPIFGKVFEHWHKHAGGRPTALYAGGVRESLWWAKSLSAQGLPAAHIDAKNIWLEGELYPGDDDDNRKSLLKRLADGRIKVLCNCQVLEVGWDMPTLSCIMLTSPIGSRAKFVQICGRGLRSAEGKDDCVFLDFAGNFWKHPMLDSDEPWDMTEAEWREKQAKEPTEFQPICCKACGFLRVSGKECPNCGEVGHLSTRQVLQVDGTLVEVTGPGVLPKVTSNKSPEQKAWESAFWGAHRSGRTFGQAFGYARKNLGGKSLPTNMRFMPRHDDDWKKRVSDVPFKELY